MGRIWVFFIVLLYQLWLADQFDWSPAFLVPPLCMVIAIALRFRDLWRSARK